MAGTTTVDPGISATTRPEDATETRTPRRWCVVVHNDDYTPFDFAVLVIHVVLRASPEEAVRIAQEVHMRGRARVGCWTRDVAETKAAEACAMARRAGHPLLCTPEPIDD